MAKNYDDIGGVWRTIGGRRVFIRNGQSLSSAMKESGKFKSAKKKNEVKDESKSFSREELKEKYGTDDVDLINAGKEKEDRVTLKEDKKELNLTQRQIDEGNRLSQKAKNMAKDDINTYLKGNKGNWDSDDDFIRDLANEHNIDRDEAQKMFNYQKYVNEKLNDDEYLKANRPNEYFRKQLKAKENIKEDFENRIKKNEEYLRVAKEQPEGAKFSKMLEESNVKTFADEIKEQSKKTEEKFSVDYFRQRGVEIKDKVPEGYVKLEGATTAPKGYEWYSNGKSRFGGEYKNALVKKEENSNQITNTLRRKAYQKYLREHPASKITFENFKDMRK